VCLGANVAARSPLATAATVQSQYQPAGTSSGSAIVLTAVRSLCEARASSTDGAPLATVGNEATARVRHRMRPLGLGAQQLLVLRQLQAMGQSGQAEGVIKRIWSTHHLAFSSCCGLSLWQGSVKVAVCTQCPSMPAAGTYLPTSINAAMWRWLVMWVLDE
jgi:hypothetical protein